METVDGVVGGGLNWDWGVGAGLWGIESLEVVVLMEDAGCGNQRRGGGSRKRR